MTATTLTAEQKQFRRKWIVLFSALESLVESGIKLLAALYTGSAGLLADCIHSATDVAGSIIVWIGVRMAPHKYRRFPYGFYKIENLLALAIGFAILYGAWEVLLVFLAGETPLPTNIPIGIVAVVLGMCLDFFWGRFEAKSGRLINSPGIEASGNHTVSDVYSSSVVLIGLLGSLFGFNLDRWAALAVAVMIAKIGIGILWDNVKVLLDISLPADKLAGYSKIVARTPGVRTVRAVRGRNAGSFRFVDIDVGIKVPDVAQANAIAADIEARLKEHDDSIDQVFVHYGHEFPTVLSIVVPTESDGATLSPYFGKASHLTTIRYDRSSGAIMARETRPNPYQRDEKHRGIHLAGMLIDDGVDSVCCFEDLSDKGPGLMFHRFGVDVRQTPKAGIDALFEDYFRNSQSVYAETPEDAGRSRDDLAAAGHHDGDTRK